MRSACRNCGDPNPGDYCPSCGQPQAEETIPTLREWILEATREILGVEGRLPRTLRALVWPPGELTREWLEGRRARYVSPLRLYLLAAIPFFFFVSMAAAPDDQRQMATGFLSFVVEASYIVSLPPEARSTEAGSMEPLPPDLVDDSAARAEWRRELERRREEASARHTADWIRVRTGLQRIYDVLPVAVGVVMVPFLALLLGVGPRPRIRFVGRMVFSLHLHTVAYTLAGVGWLFGAAGWTGAIGTTLYLGIARHRLQDERLPVALVGSFIFPILYAVGFLVCYVTLVWAATMWAPGWVFGG